jgi:mannose-1-phosphate guanylyltransferase/phosphomannomutase
MELVVLAGGKGTRLGRTDAPKPMVPIAGKPVLQWIVEWAVRSGMANITLVCHHQSDMIAAWFGDGARFGARIRYVVEQTPMGTAGALLALRGQMADRFMVVFADLVLDFDAERMIAFDAAAPALATIMVHPNNHPYDSDLVEVANGDGVVTAMHGKPHDSGAYYQNLVNAGAFILDPSILAHIPLDTPCDFGRDLFPKLVREGRRVRAYHTFEYISDMGTPDRLARIERDLVSGVVGRRHRRHQQRAIFLDRDGVLNIDDSPVVSAADLRLFPGAAAGVRTINESGYLAVVITNQPGLAKGFLTERDLVDVHRKLEWELAREGAFLDALYYCPHHPERGFAGEVAELKRECDCRKPAPGMLFRASADLNIDLSASWMIGDRQVDVQAAGAAGVRSLLVRPGDLREAVSALLGEAA